MNTGQKEEDLILDSISAFLERDVKPHVRELEHDDIYPQEIVDRMKDLGLFGAIIQPEFGGLGLSAGTYAKIVVRISEVWMSLTGIFNSHLMMAAAVQKFGAGEQKQRFLPRFATGELQGALALPVAWCRPAPPALGGTWKPVSSTWPCTTSTIWPPGT